MSINWIATNPKPNMKNQANQAPMPDNEFEEFIRLLIHVYFIDKKINTSTKYASFGLKFLFCLFYRRFLFSIDSV